MANLLQRLIEFGQKDFITIDDTLLSLPLTCCVTKTIINEAFIYSSKRYKRIQKNE
jgi:hypothetical protein